MQKIQFKKSTKYGNPTIYRERWWHSLLFITWLPAIAIVLIGSFLLKIADFLLMDTHHFNLEVTGKEKL